MWWFFKIFLSFVADPLSRGCFGGMRRRLLLGACRARTTTVVVYSSLAVVSYISPLSPATFYQTHSAFPPTLYMFRFHSIYTIHLLLYFSLIVSNHTHKPHTHNIYSKHTYTHLISNLSIKVQSPIYTHTPRYIHLTLSSLKLNSYHI